MHEASIMLIAWHGVKTEMPACKAEGYLESVIENRNIAIFSAKCWET